MSYPSKFNTPSVKRQAVDVTRAQVSITADNVSYGPESEMVFQLPGGTAGMVLDPTSTMIRATVQILNNHHAVDYTHISKGGLLSSMIDSVAVKVNGVDLEQLEKYGMYCAFQKTIKMPSTRKKLSNYFSNKEKGVNPNLQIIKPPMCTSNGVIMYGTNHMGGLGLHPEWNSRSQFTSKATFPTVSPGAYAAGKDFNLHKELGLCTANPQLCYLQQTTAFDAALTTAEDSRANWFGCQPIVNTRLVASNGLTNNVLPIKPCGANPTAMDWPDYLDSSLCTPMDKEIIEHGSINVMDVADDLCGLKCYAIGCIPAHNCYNTSATGTYATDDTKLGIVVYPSDTATAGLTVPETVTATNPTGSSNAIEIIHRLRSGILGSMARKVFLLFLVQVGQLKVHIRTGRVEIALRPSFDPCRRLSGTIRDYVRNIGIKNYGIYTTNPKFKYGTAPGRPWDFDADSNMALGYIPGVDRFSLGSGPGDAALNSIYTVAATEGMLLLSRMGTGNLAPVSKIVSEVLTADPAFPGLHTAVAGRPQYALAQKPWLFKTPNATSTTRIAYANDLQALYGTRCAYSVPQTPRMFSITYDGKIQGTYPDRVSETQKLTFLLSNVKMTFNVYYFQQPGTKRLLDRAQKGGFNVMCTSYGIHSFPLAAMAEQDLPLPMSYNQATELYLLPQNDKRIETTTALYYDSTCSDNIFSYVTKGKDNTLATRQYGRQMSSDGSVIPLALTGVGFKSPLEYGSSALYNSKIGIQMTLGNTKYPYNKIESIQQLIQFNTESDFAIEKAEEKNGMDCIEIVNLYNPSTKATVPSYNLLQDEGFATVFVNHELLDDQTIMDNPSQSQLFSVYSDTDTYSGAYGTTGVSIEDSDKNGLNYMCPRGHCLDDIFMTPNSRFFMHFTFRLFDEVADDIRSFQFLGAQQNTLSISNATALTVPGEKYNMIAILEYEAFMSYGDNGQIFWKK